MDRNTSLLRAPLGSLALCILLGWTGLSHSALAQYAYHMGEASFDKGVDVELDALGNAYFVGEFRSTLDFDPGPDEWPIESLNTDVFVTSYDPAGHMRFAFKLSGSQASHESVGDIAVRSDGSFVVTGSQPFGSIDFDPDPQGARPRTGHLFIAGYDAQGQYRFAVSPTNSDNLAAGMGNGVALDDSGNVYATGFFATSLDFDPDADSSGTLMNKGGQDAFIVSYDQNGQHRFGFSIGNEGYDLGNDIVVDSEGNVYVTGYFSDEVLFDPEDKDGDGNQEPRTSVGRSDIFLASYTQDGLFRFAYPYTVYGSPRYVDGFNLALDGEDNVYMAGKIENLVAFDPEDVDQDGDLEQRDGGALGSAFFVSYTSEGIPRFAYAFTGGVSHFHDISTNEAGISFLTGSFSGNIDFDPGHDKTSYSSRRGADVIVASYDSTGQFRTAFRLESAGLSAGFGVDFDAEENVYLTGGLTGDLDMDPSDGVDMRTGAGQNDIFMARYLVQDGTRVSTERPAGLPYTGPVLAAPYPNPFVSSAHVRIKVDSPEPVRLIVYDLLGRVVDRLHDGQLTTGSHEFVWQASDQPGGVYFLRVETATGISTQRMVKIR